MLRKVWLFLTIAMILPTFALAAGTLSLTASPTGGGTLSIGGVDRTGTTYSFTVASGLTEAVTVTGTGGNTIKMVTQNGVNITGAGANQASFTYNIKNNNYAQALVAYFNVPTSSYKVSVVASTGSGSVKLQQTAPTAGTISGVSVSGTKLSTTVVTVSAAPAAGYKVTQIVTANPDATFTFSGAAGATATQNLTSTQIGTATTAKATFALVPTVTASVQAGGSMVIGSAVSLTGTVSSNDTFGATPYQFVVKQAGVQIAASGAQASTSYSYTPAASGDYTVEFTATTTNGGTAVATAGFHVYTAAEASVNLCSSCHNSRNPDLMASYEASNHYVKAAATCATCHVGAETTHPGATVTATACESCHTATLSTTTHPADITASKCITCHDPHNPAQGIADLTPSNHPTVTLYTFEEIGMQMAGGQKVPVQVDANGKGMPYSPKQTCGTSGCHIKNGVDYTYDKISDHAFHSAQGRNEFQDSATGKLDATKNKPWLQSTAMVGKW